MRVWSIDINGETFIERQVGPRQFRVVFDVEVNPGEFLSLADIRVYNLSKDTVVDRRSRIVLRAGDESNEDVIFMGYVTNVFRERDPGSAHIALRMICKSGAPYADRASAQKTFGKGTSVVDVIRSLAEAWYIPLEIDPQQFAGDSVLASGFVLDGDIPTALDKLAYAYNFEWVQELGRLVVTKPDMGRTVMAPLKINQYTGMIGVPEVTRGPNGIGVFVSTQLNPFAKINGKIDILSEYSTFNTGNLYIQELAGDATANGEYNIFSLHHRGDSHGSLWATDIDGVRPGTVLESAAVAEDSLVWGQKVTAEFRAKVRLIAQGLSVDPNWLMAVMGFETGYSFDPSIKNPGSSATGLIQFTDSTARGLGTTTAKLSRMTALDQLDYVAAYYGRFAGRMMDIGDAYMAVLWPVAVGRPDSYVLWERDTGPYQTEYARNSGLDLNGDGKITRGEAVTPVNKSLINGRNYAR